MENERGTPERDPNYVSAGPTKRFFVEMLTRDIELQDAILDLLDNCVDGILRIIKDNQELAQSDTPYAGFQAEINFSRDYFSIKDNCGGIPKRVAKEQAFMMGRSDERDRDLPTVGMYGIGMKRAIFKMGRSCSVKSYTQEGAFEVIISPEWMSSEEWGLELNEIENVDGIPHGTSINITHLNQPISNLFEDNQPIYQELPNRIAQFYNFIIAKGFKIFVNGREVITRQIQLIISEDGVPKSGTVSPYIYKADLDGVDVSLAVGFYRRMPDTEEVDDEQIYRRSSADSGWTVVCNDRVVIYNDKSIMTGWGEAGVPAYHTQFIGIVGVVFFQSTDASKLPLTTTKRGVEASSPLYLHVKNYMRQGLKKFTDYTNHWKVDIAGERRNYASAVPMDIKSIMEIDTGNWTRVANKPNETRLDLPLARPVEADPLKQIKYSKRESEILAVKELLFGPDSTARPTEIGEATFNYFFDQAGAE